MNKRDPKSYYIKIYRENGDRFFVIRVSEHTNLKNQVLISSTFFDINGRTEDEANLSVEECLKLLNRLIDFARDRILIQDVTDLL